MRNWTVSITATLAILLGIASAASAQVTEQEFYSGKVVRMILPVNPGDGYDTWGRLIAKHIGRHLPGKPDVVPSNMPGAGGLTAANHLYNIAAKDGTVIGLVPRDVPMAPLMGQQSARFDAAKLSWIGSPTSETSVCFSMTGRQVASLDDMKMRELIVGSVGTGAGSYIYPKVLGEVFGLKVKLIPGYNASGDVYLALERGEIDGFCGSYRSVIKARPDWASTKRLTFLLQGGAERNPELAGVPFILDRARNDEERQMLLLLYAGQGMGWPFLAPPSIPPDRLTMLRKAFDETMQDAEFAADARKQDLELQPMTGPYLEALINKVYATPPSLVQRLSALIK